MSERLYFTSKGLEKYTAEVEKIEKELSDMQSRIGSVAETGGNQWHDNASFDYLTAEIRQTNQRLAGMRAVLSRGMIAAMPVSNKTVALGTKVKVLWNGEEQEWYIGGYGESDFDNHIISYNTPLAELMKGKKVGEIAVGKIGRNNVTINILEISIPKDDDDPSNENPKE